MLGGATADPVVSTAGAMLGKYQLVRRIATGGMAELYLARSSAIHGFEKIVVLKRILPQYAESEDFIRMFLAEARLAATLHHPNIVQVYDIGEQDSAYFFTMEYVMGQDLRKLVRAARKAGRALPLEHILHIVMGVAAGLNHAHDKIGLDGRPLGIVHRDVSPSNVLVTYDGGVKVVDFGIAKAASSQNNTVAGTLKGKIPYMSPEQCRGEHVDARSDIFSIGTLLWELTTGQRLFAGDNEFALINRVAKGDVPTPSSVRAEYPPELEAIVMRALQPLRDNRYASAQDLQIDLEDFAREARLPVSSARMAKFMRELFAQEIQASRDLLAVEYIDENPTVPRPTLTRSLLTGETVATPVPSTELLDLTPSEVRSGNVVATPGPAERSYSAGSEVSVSMGPASATDLSYHPAPTDTTDNRAKVIVAVVIAAMLLLGLGSGFLYQSLAKTDGDSSDKASERAPEPTKKIEPREPVVADAPEDEPLVIPPSPDADADADADPGGAPPAALPEPAADGDDEPKPEPTPEPTSDTPPKNDKTSAGGSSTKPTKRPKKKPPKANSDDTSKTKWNPDSPFPI